MKKKALKSCLGVKASTPDDIVYVELNVADIISTIRDRQFNFFTKVMELENETAIAMSIWKLYNDMVDAESGGIIHYFQNLEPKNKQKNREKRIERINTSTRTMTIRYREITKLEFCDILYDSFVVEKNRRAITRWRLSSHSLRIETGRYQRPKTPRNERTCIVCNTMEDEQHSLFVCTAHTFIRTQYTSILSTYTTVSSILHPTTIADANTIGNLILDIERNMDALKMVFKY